MSVHRDAGPAVNLSRHRVFELAREVRAAADIAMDCAARGDASARGGGLARAVAKLRLAGELLKGLDDA